MADETTGQTSGPSAGAAGADSAAEDQCDHDWTLVNRDENRLIYKCLRCGALRSE